MLLVAKKQKNDGHNNATGSSPTLSSDGLIVTTAIDAHEEIDVATMDISSAFLHAINDEHIIMLLKGKAVER